MPEIGSLQGFFQTRETAAKKPRPDLDAGDEILSKVENDE
jgi:hypothetical protein